MTIFCYPRKRYYVALKKWKSFPDGGGTNFIATPHLGKARYYAKKLKVKYRQIDVRERGANKKPYVLEGSWL